MSHPSQLAFHVQHPHARPAEEIFTELDASSEGLTPQESARRLEQVGPNRLPTPPKEKLIKRFCKHFHDLLICILLTAALVTALLAHWIDTSVILAVLLVNAIIGFIQEGKAEHALAGIRKMLSLHAHARRNGEWLEIPADELVPGDVVRLRSGDRVPADLRLSTVPCGGAEKLTLRLLDPRRMEHRIHELGLGPRAMQQLEHWSRKVSGLLLVTGPTGSGKTTTLYSLVHELELSSHSVLTIEDPIECPFDGISQIQVNEAAGLTFAAALKSMLRLDPDDLLVGEMRDSDSARVALEATATGHCVMSTLHSPDAPGVVTLRRNWGTSANAGCPASSRTAWPRLAPASLPWPNSKTSAPFIHETKTAALPAPQYPAYASHSHHVRLAFRSRARGRLTPPHRTQTGRVSGL